jgi:hypothetical protein
MNKFWEIIMDSGLQTVKRLAAYTKSLQVQLLDLQVQLQAALAAEADPEASLAMQAEIDRLQALVDTDTTEDADAATIVSSLVPVDFVMPVEETTPTTPVTEPEPVPVTEPPVEGLM